MYMYIYIYIEINESSTTNTTTQHTQQCKTTRITPPQGKGKSEYGIQRNDYFQAASE